MTNRGFTTIEILVTLSILVFLAVMTFFAFSSYKKRQSVDLAATIVKSALEEARSKTLDSYEATNYGVHLNTEEVTIFTGVTYDSNDPQNESRTLPTPSYIDDYTLTTSNVYFERLTGEPSEDGSITIKAYNLGDFSKKIVIEPTGISYVE